MIGREIERGREKKRMEMCEEKIERQKQKGREKVRRKERGREKERKMTEDEIEKQR